MLGGETSCLQTKISGYYASGTFQQYCVTSAHYATVIPDGLPLDSTAPLMCAGLSVYAGLTRAGIRPGDWVLVTGGGGGLGHLGVQYARALGGRVLAIDSDPKESVCREVGADEFIDFTQFPKDTEGGEAMAAKIRELTAGGAKIALMCSSNAGSYEQCMYWLRFRGVIIALGVPDVPNTKIADPGYFLNFELKLIGVKAANRLETAEALALAARGSIKTHFQLRPMEDLTTVSYLKTLTGIKAK